MDMDLQNQLQKDTSPLQLDGSTHNPLVQSHEPKVRKPYTISKQREKWTGEEHQKFLDALKLFGRAWRQIQEFIGTKTAVQIRSHAQKFFSKVVQGGNDNTESRVADIEIPPPRPKRKPAHPYPRKYVDPQSVVASSSFQPEKRICFNSVNANSENRSPDSVLSAAMTQTLELPVSELPDSCLSNSSCSTGTQSGNLFSIDGEDNSNAMNRSASSTVDNSANMHIMSPEKEADLPAATIKLFGQIVSTKDLKRPYADGNETSLPSEKHSAVHADNKYGKLEESPSSNVTDAQLSQALYYSNWTPWPMHDVNSDSTCASLQWMPIPLYTGIPPPYLISYSQSQNNTSPYMGERTTGKELCSSSIKNNSTEETKEGVYALSTKRINKSGFVPYKRCSASTQGPIVSATVNAEEDDAQRVRLCL